ncbi:hypothetical protein [Lysinibacillus pakistanensis]|uniref:Uncharacterized protein n=1 Tax=Lysinibacillus pakistanensis TaxID=759811 RepID=A0AAX3WNJ1_9BACI|nr:hypothetical protein [Lysinibacillus pakistanensis]MDM5233767.1 hypothetical protein [Lysinibacillus pakistanensis]QGG51789.1 hypothetical protein GDS87_12915 [Lysinibacillus pakistanensis]WHY44389.1 hypothetical protein QNH22_13700 [Lysinibacillus pakistanensis]WHY49397.1 hypothetical protein QNH24_13680 [Lysinibacillus pakistanensis]
MKSNFYSPSTPCEQGALLACPFQNAQKSGKAYDTTFSTSTEVKHKSFSPNMHFCTGIIPFDVMEKNLNITPQIQRINEIGLYCSGKEIARWLVKKSEYNKLEFDFFL